MAKRILTITLQADWKTALRAAGRAAQQAGYQGETLNFESPGAFFARLSERRWALLNALQAAGPLSQRELARRLGRDVKRVHEDAHALLDLGLIERDATGALCCPFADIHVDMHLQPPAVAA